MGLKIVGMKEILQVFEVTDRLGISREIIEIPLSPEHPDQVRKLSNGKIEIISDSGGPLSDWIPKMKNQIKKII